MGQATKFSLSVIALLLAYHVLTYIHSRISRWRKAKQLGCKEPPRFPHLDPILGLDLFLANGKAHKEHRLLDTLKERWDAYGQTYSFIRLGVPSIATNDPQNIQAVHGTKFEDYGLAPLRRATTLPFLGQGMFNTDGAFWQHSRALIRPTFNRKHIANLKSFERHLGKMMKLAPTDGSTFNLQLLLDKLFLDTSTEFFFGESMNILDPETPFQTTEFLNAFAYCQVGIGNRQALTKFVFLHRDPKWYRSIEICHAVADKYVDLALEFRKKYLAEKAAGKKAEKEDRDEAREDSPEGNFVLLHEMAKLIDDRIDLRNQIIQIFLAGYDSSAITVSNAMFQLCRHPEKWQTLREEVLQADELTFESLKEMEYLQYVVKETLRLYPVAPTDTRVALRDTVLPMGGGKDGKSPIMVMAGEMVSTSTHALHRRPEYFGEEVELFKPERWKKCRTGWHYGPFGGGPRMCPGQNLALTQVAYVLARLAQSWEEVICKDKCWDWVEELKLTACSANGCIISVKS